MALYDDKAPGVYIEEVAGGARPIQAVGTSTAGFLGIAPLATAHVLRPIPINNWTQFNKEFCNGGAGDSTNLARAVYGFFQNGGRLCYVVNLGEKALKEGLDELARFDDVAIVAAPGYTGADDYDDLITHCENLKDRVAILDSPETVDDIDQLKVVCEIQEPAFTILVTDPSANLPEGVSAQKEGDNLKLAGTGEPDTPVRVLGADRKQIKSTKVRADGKWEMIIPFPGKGEKISIAKGSAKGLKPPQSAYAAFYFPWIRVRDPLLPRKDLKTLKDTPLVYTAPSGYIAGIWARSDASRGVHKAPANEPIRGALGIKSAPDRRRTGLPEPGRGQLHPFLCSRGDPGLGCPHPGAKRRMALPERAPAVQHDRRIGRGEHTLDRV